MPAVKFGDASGQEDNFPDRQEPLDPSAWTDEEFREAFESLRIPNGVFHHREHIRLAWIYCVCFPVEEAILRIESGIRTFAKHHGADQKYHHTITLAWMRLVGGAKALPPVARQFTDFAAAHPYLLEPGLLANYYSPERLNSTAARQEWVEPDLRPLPAAPRCPCPEGAVKG